MNKKFLILLACILVSCAPAPQPQPSRELNIYFWENYMAPNLIEDFENETNITVHIDYFTEENSMESVIASNPGKYDLSVSTDQIVRELIASRLLAELNYSYIPNFEHVDPLLKDPSYDAMNLHSVPYLWGTTGVAINTKYIPASSDSWGVLWDSRYAGKIGMLSDRREVIAAGLKYAGFSLNTKTPDELDSARLLLLRQKSLVAHYATSYELMPELSNGTLWAVQAYNGDLFAYIENTTDFKYFVPKEGARMWVDNLFVPEDARHKQEAYAFINFILRPDISARIADYNHYATSNRASLPLISKDDLSNPSIYPTADVRLRLEEFDESGLTNKQNEIWAELQR